VLVFVVSSWHRLAPSGISRAIVRRRRALGLAFATAHTIHLGALVANNAVAGQVPDAVALSTELYRRFMQQGGLQGEIASILAVMQPSTMTHFGTRNLYWIVVVLPVVEFWAKVCVIRIQ